MSDADDFEQLARRAGAELRVPPPVAAIDRIEQSRRRHTKVVGAGAALATIGMIAIAVIVWPRSATLQVQGPTKTTNTTRPTTEATPTTVAGPSTTSATQEAPSTTALPVPTPAAPVTSTIATGPTTAPTVPVVWPGTPQKIIWKRTTVDPGPYNGILHSDGYGLISLNPSIPNVVLISDDGTTWERRELPAGFLALDSSRSSELVAVAGYLSGGVLAVAVSTQGAAWQVSKLVDPGAGGRGPALGEPVTRIGVSGTRITVIERVGPPTGSKADTFLRFTGDGGAPFTSEVAANLSLVPEGMVVPSIGAYESVDYLGRRDDGGYFAINDGAAPGRVRAIARGAAIILDDTIAARAFGGLSWQRTCCLNSEPSIGVGQVGLVALATNQPLDLSKLAVAISSNGSDWHVESIGNLVTEQGLDVTKLFVLDGRIVIVVTNPNPRSEGTGEAVVLVGQVT